jgi:hypothetical protein
MTDKQIKITDIDCPNCHAPKANGVNVTGKSWAARYWLARFVHGKSYV